MDDKDKNKNCVTVAYCPICGREMFWLPVEPVNYPGADYLAFCGTCLKQFGVEVGKGSANDKNK